MAIRRWWHGKPDEVYWLEITRRGDLGADLRAPQNNERGQEYWSYALVREVADGDIVFHYSMHDNTIRLWSRAAGGWWDDDIYWGARGTVGRSSDPYDRPGWCHGLDGPFELDGLVTLEDLRGDEAALRDIRDDLLEQHGTPLYFPFELSNKRPLRAGQGYLFKLPAAVVQSVAAFSGVDTRPPPDISSRARPPASKLGDAYRRPDETLSLRARDPFEVDPAVVERGLRGHMRAQNLLHDHLADQGIAAKSHAPTEPAFDLAWERNGRVWVAEVKSLTRRNEERQLRLGLGQVLRYRQLISGRHRSVRAVLMVERQPCDPMWDELCRDLGVILAWPSVLPKRVRP